MSKNIVAVIGAKPPEFISRGLRVSGNSMYAEYHKIVIDANFDEWLEFKGHESKKSAAVFQVGLNSITKKKGSKYAEEIKKQGAKIETHVVENSDGTFSVWVCKHEAAKNE